jgi:hypothetical protein
MSYILVNPLVQENHFTSNVNQAGGAAEDLWGQLSNNIKQFTPKFYFSIKDTKKDKLFHYKVKESMEGGKVKYVIKEHKKINDKLPVDNLDGGGSRSGKKYKKYRKHHSDDDSSSSDSDSSSSSSSSSSSDSSDSYRRRKSSRNNNLSLSYYPSIYGVPNVLLPTFSTSFSPFVDIRMNVGLPSPLRNIPTVVTYGSNVLGVFGNGYNNGKNW